MGNVHTCGPNEALVVSGKGAFISEYFLSFNLSLYSFLYLRRLGESFKVRYSCVGFFFLTTTLRTLRKLRV